MGREAELARIADAQAEGRCGVVLCAEAGIGKSRLGREAVATALSERDTELAQLAAQGLSDRRDLAGAIGGTHAARRVAS